jgi:hypothetical protein
MSSSPAPQPLLSALYQRLQGALTDEYARRFDEGVVLHREDEETSDTPDRLHFRIDYQGLPELAATLSIPAEDDGAYTVCCAVQHGDEKRFSYRPPRDPEGPDPELERLGEAMASFLLTELQKELSRLVLDTPRGDHLGTMP